MLEDSGGDCSIEEFSISFFGDSHPPDFSILSLLLHMENLSRLDIHIWDPWRATQVLCDYLCDLLKQGTLQELNVVAATAKEGLYLPLLDAADKSDTLMDLRLQRLQNQAEVETYQDAMLGILDHNTQLWVALICKEVVTNGTLFLNTCGAMQAHGNKEWFLDQTEGSNKQRLIDYNTVLNICGREKTKAEDTCLQDLVHMISPKTLQKKISFLGFKGDSEQELITILQHGLLCQHPASWVSNGKQAQGYTKGRSHKKSTGEVARKRRRVTVPEDESSPQS
ncbi:expressed unknown protein [Seminavis robusta]|uniref:Uncharacterized protein n=1 Tax=Seminavis robusta TaxID=568900 RepID=A0A9N8H547_9STRA|nr:expressed unknown protein [Seminavis robusta]|eukprot:Sro133_g062830.1 n/a (281) ;mRNA; r:5357-6199